MRPEDELLDHIARTLGPVIRRERHPRLATELQRHEAGVGPHRPPGGPLRKTGLPRAQKAGVGLGQR